MVLFLINFLVKTLNVFYVILYFFVARLFVFFFPTEFLRVSFALRINSMRHLCLEQCFVEEKAQCNYCVEKGDLYFTSETIIFLLIPQNNKALYDDQQKKTYSRLPWEVRGDLISHNTCHISCSISSGTPSNRQGYKRQGTALTLPIGKSWGRRCGWSWGTFHKRGCRTGKNLQHI